MKGVSEVLGRRAESVKLQTVIFAAFFSAALLFLLLLAAGLLLRFGAITTQLVEEDTMRMVLQVNHLLDDHLREIMSLSDTLYYQVVKDEELEDGERTELFRLLCQENDDIASGAVLFDHQGRILSSWPHSQLRRNAEPREEGWYREAMVQPENLHFSSPYVQNLFDDQEDYRWVISVSQAVQITRQGRTEKGILLVDTNYTSLRQLLSGVELPNGGYVYLMDADGELISHPWQQLIYSGIREENHLAAAGYADGVHYESWQDQNRMVVVRTVGYTGWKLVGVVGEEGLGWQNMQLLPFAVSLLLFVSCLLAVLISRIAALVTDPIRRLERAVKQIESGVLDLEIRAEGSYEVRRLSSAISAMVATLRRLMEDIRRQERAKRRSDLDVLQSQINPHFLYNTLDSVVWMTEAGRTEEAVEMVSALAKLFRISLSEGRSEIPLERELEHARNYLAIQKIRYRSTFSASITAQPGTEELPVVKLVIQPILENALYHGIDPMEEENHIQVRAYLEGEDLLIDISDDGRGMRPEVAATLLDESKPWKKSKGSGVGVRNVHQRLRLTYGEGYGVTIFSEPDEGTLVRLRLPARRAEEEREEGASHEEG